MAFFKIKNFSQDNKTIKVVNVSYVENKIEKKLKKKVSDQNKNFKNEEKKPKAKNNNKGNIVDKKTSKKPVSKKNKNKKNQSTQKKEQLKNAKKFDDMLKNLAAEDLEENKNDDIDNKIKNLSKEELLDKNKKENKKEIQAIMNLLMNQINNNWTRPPAIKGYENLVIKIDIYLTPSGSVYSIVESSNVKKLVEENIHLKPLLDSAIRAIKKSSPFEGIQKYSYNKWKKNTINFRPFENTQ